MASEVTRVKPQLKGLGLRAWTRVLYTSVFLSAGLAVFLKYAYVERNKKKINDFYKNYDVEKEYQLQKKAGIFKGFENGA